MIKLLATILIAIPALCLAGLAVANDEGLDLSVGFSDPLQRQVTAQIEAAIAHKQPATGTAQGVEKFLNRESLHSFYAQRNYLPAWVSGQSIRPAAFELLNILRASGDHALCSEEDLLQHIESLMAMHSSFVLHKLPLAPNNQATLDLLLTEAFLGYANHLVEGQVDPALVHVEWRARRRKVDLVKLLNYALTKDRLKTVLTNLQPKHPGYRRLQDALQRYREISALGGWPAIPTWPTIRPNTVDKRLPLLRKRIMISGDLDSGNLDWLDPELQGFYDPVTRAGVERFQARHGLQTDGVIGPKTFKALNVSAETRVHQIELNLERWRWLPKELGPIHIEVNVADFSMTVVEDGAVVMTMPVVVGTTYRKTPVFSARMRYLEFAPYWFVPQTILREDKLPKIKADPNYLKQRHFKIVRYNGEDQEPIDPEKIDWNEVEAKDFPGMLRQDPGPWNPLGRVKFMFPNSFDVYLHDTPDKYLFFKEKRSYSSGCIRVQRPMDLAQYLLERQPDWDCDRLLLYMNLEVPVRVDIKPLPVHILYWTAWVGADGEVHFRPDVYWRDLDLQIALSDPEFRTLDRLQTRMPPVRRQTASLF